MKLGAPILSNVGIKLGIGTALLSTALDQEQKVFPPTNLYVEAIHTSLFNLLIVGPFIHARVTKYLSHKKRFWTSAFDIFSITAIHSVVYSWIHRGMHKIVSWRPIHKFHHKFKKNVAPTVANAVSVSEFTFAYMSPFVIGVMMVAPTQPALCVSVSIISILNLLVHSNKLKYEPWINGLVAPYKHLKHHYSKIATYSAPLYDWEYILSKFSWKNILR